MDEEEVVVKMKKRSFVAVCRAIFGNGRRTEEEPVAEPEEKEEWTKPKVVKRECTVVK